MNDDKYEENLEHERDEALDSLPSKTTHNFISDEEVSGFEGVFRVRLDGSAKALFYFSGTLSKELSLSSDGSMTAGDLLIGFYLLFEHYLSEDELLWRILNSISKENWGKAISKYLKQKENAHSTESWEYIYANSYNFDPLEKLRYTVDAKDLIERAIDRAHAQTNYPEKAILNSLDILSVLIENPTPQSREILRIFEENGEQSLKNRIQAELLQSGISKPKPKPKNNEQELGKHFDIKNRPDEFGGDTDIYAEVIFKILQQAKIPLNSNSLASTDKDFVFALFGAWGMGKTTLINEVSKKLMQENTATVVFNAWKYQHRPEIWVYLYTTLKQAAEALYPSPNNLLASEEAENNEHNGIKGCWHRTGLAIRFNLSQNGGLPLFFPALILLSLSLIPWILTYGFNHPELPETFKKIPKSIATWTALLLSILPFIALVKFFKNAAETFGVPLKEQLNLPDHKKHLGLQAIIGKDLKRLLRTWTSPLPFKSKVIYHVSITLILLAIILHLLRSWDFILLISPWVTIPLLGTIVICAFWLFVLPKNPSQHPDKVHLVVDDLDRCPPTEMLSLIESLRVCLDDPKIASALHITLLLDREILIHNILENHDILVEKSAISETRLIQDQLDKYFLCSFDLPPLSPISLKSIASKFIGNIETEKDNPPSAPNEENIVPPKPLRQTTAVKTNKGEIPPQKKATAAEKKGNTHRESNKVRTDEVKRLEVTLSTSEKKGLITLVEKLAEDQNKNVTPRSIRQLQIKYYLTRILAEKKFNLEDFNLMEQFSNHLQGNEIAFEPPNNINEVLKKELEELFLITARFTDLNSTIPKV